MNVKRVFCVLLCLSMGFLLYEGCGSGQSVAVTQTGNPTKVTLNFKVDTAQAPAMPKRSVRTADMAVSSITISSAVLVITEFSLTDETAGETLEFESRKPYVVDLHLGGSPVTIDSLILDSARSFASAEVHIGVLEQESALFAAYPQLQGKSIRVDGYVNGDHSQTFSFSTSITVEKEFAFSVPISVQEGDSTSVLMAVSAYQWFSGAEGSLLDPREEENRSDIESNIKLSMKVAEDKDEDGEMDDEETDE